MGTYTDDLNRMKPSTGRFIAEDGEIYNLKNFVDGIETTLTSVDRSWDEVKDSATGTIKTSDLTPLWSQHVEDKLLNLTNIATNTTAYGYLDMDGYRFLGIEGDTSGSTPTDVLTVTVEGTMQDDGTAQASCTYVDITKLFFDAATGARATASWVDTDFVASLADASAFKYIRVKYVTSNGGGSDADLVVHTKRMA